VATGGYIANMNYNVKIAKDKLSELLDRVESGDRIVITRNGKPVADLVSHVPQKKKMAIDWEALAATKQRLGITKMANLDLEEFNKPLPEDFLITPITFQGEK
jgi:prevent-host-death family protein